MKKPFQKQFAFWISFFCLYGAGCDTCNIGETFVNPRIKSGFETSEEGLLFLVIEWDEGMGKAKDLPASYFEAARVGSFQSPLCSDPEHAEYCNAIYEAVSYTEPHQFNVFFSSEVQDNFAEQSLSFAINLPDRRQFIECRHPGSDDSYSLIGSLLLDENGVIIDSSFLEDLSLGHI